MKDTGDGRRVARVESEVQRLVAQYLIEHMREKLPGLVTVSRVHMPADLRSARVYISVLTEDFIAKTEPVLEISQEKSAADIITIEETFDSVISDLQEVAVEIQKFIGQNLRMRYCPKLTFHEDEVTKKVLKIEEIMREISDHKKSQ